MSKRKGPAVTTTRTTAPRKGPIPPNWQPSADSAMLAARLSLDPDEEAEMFRDYSLARGDVRADWNAAFRGWCRNRYRNAAERIRWLKQVDYCLDNAEHLTPWQIAFLNGLCQFYRPSVKQLATLDSIVFRVDSAIRSGASQDDQPETLH